jgi:hypothetical protein
MDGNLILVVQAARCLLLVVIFLAATSSGCRERQTQGGAMDQLAITLDSAYTGYLTSAVSEARASLNKCVQLLQENRQVSLQAKAHGLWLTYARLAVLEESIGNTNASTINMLKCAYWYAIKLEEMGEPPEQVAARLQLVTPDYVRELVRKWDDVWSTGAGPAYATLSTNNEISGVKSPGSSPHD